MRGATLSAIALGTAICFSTACPRQGPQLGPGEDGVYEVSIELSHPDATALLLDDDIDAPPEQWSTVERVQRRPTMWSNGQPVQFAEEGQSIEVRLTPLSNRQLSVELRYSFHSPQPFSGSQTVLLAPEQLASLELRLSNYRLQVAIEP